MTEPTSTRLSHLGTLGFYLVPTSSPLRQSHHLYPSSSQSSQLSPEGTFLKCKLALSLTTQHSWVSPDHVHREIQGLGHDLGQGSSWVPSPPNPLTRMVSHLPPSAQHLKEFPSPVALFSPLHSGDRHPNGPSTPTWWSSVPPAKMDIHMGQDYIPCSRHIESA